MEDRIYNVYVRKRPGVDTFLQTLSNYYELIIYTASVPTYATPIINKLGPISHSLFRNHCSVYHNTFVKDLSLLGRDLAKTIIIDNSPSAYSLQPENAIPIKTWIGDITDKELIKLIPILKDMSEVNDVREHIKKNINLKVKQISSSFSSEENVFKIKPQSISIRIRLNKGGIRFPKSFESRSVITEPKTIKSKTKLIAFVDNKPTTYTHTQLEAATNKKHSLEYYIINTTYTQSSRNPILTRYITRPPTSSYKNVNTKCKYWNKKRRTNRVTQLHSIIKSPIHFTKTSSINNKGCFTIASIHGAH